jgi:hypothetical protein
MLFGNIMISGKMKRRLQLITGFHRIHSVVYSYGYKIPFTSYGIFYKWELKKLGKIKVNNNKVIDDYHNCTLTNRY